MSCPECFSGHVHEGEPTGKTAKLYGLDTYVAEPKSGRPAKGVIVIIPDAFGWEFVNNRILADHYAEKSDYKVYLPDFMYGTAAPLWVLETLRGLLEPRNYLWKPYHIFWMIYGVAPFLWKNHAGKSYPVARGFFSQLRKEEPDLPVGVAGFCWGGKLSVMLAWDEAKTPEGRPLIDAGFTGHPSLMVIPGDAEKMVRPMAFAVGDTDTNIPAPKLKVLKEVTEGLPGEAKGEVVEYKGCAHGFCVRADVTFKDSEVAKQAAEAEDQCLAWFDAKFPS